uniref:F-box domain-containing protein n=1 Tax=Mycena chlorophos TaxID=658473 RepID=A0ABQ0M2C0_MYCCL|nr:predicted protein [Mycena chlorophos]
MHVTVEHALDFVKMLEPGRNIKEFPICTAPGHSVAELYAAIAGNFSPIALQKLRVGLSDVNVSGDMEPPPPRDLLMHIVDGAALVPLLEFSSLTKPVLEPTAGFDLDDAMAHRIAAAFPNLEKLSLISASSLLRLHFQSPRLTLASLPVLVGGCPKLTSLAVELDAQSVSPLHRNEFGGDVSHSAPYRIDLDVGYSPIRHTGAVAEFLLAVLGEISPLHASGEWEG